MIHSGKIAEITGAEILSYPSETTIHHLLLDSRKIISPSQSLFFAIKGVRHDGHLYIDQLYQKGVRCFIVEENHTIIISNYPNASFWKVVNSITALQKIVSYHRTKFTIPVIGLTGSNGKTIIKEWLAQLLAKDFRIVKNPKSYNSQVGVPLSVWEMNEKHTLGIFEAGISLPNEMIHLEKIIHPTIGILTNIGPAHDEGFKNQEEKILEKITLFKNVSLLIYRKENKAVNIVINNLPIKTLSWSTNEAADIKINLLQKSNQSTELQFTYNKINSHLRLPFTDDASIENAIHCVAVLLFFNKSVAEIQLKLNLLQPVAMRLELKEGVNGSFIIDDTYNNDLSGLSMALNFLDQKKQRKKKTIILSDLLEVGVENHLLYAQIAEMLKEKEISTLIGIGKEISENSNLFTQLDCNFYKTTEDFLNALNPKAFAQQVILIKGARKFAFEHIVKALQHKVHGTLLEINLDALSHNLNYYRSKLLPDTKIMVMVKALAYGSGSFEVANLLQFHRVDYLAVAYADEGVALRENGITLPIMVMNPTPDAFNSLIQYQLEPELYSLKIAEEFIHFLRDTNQTSSVHIKIDTGMRRLGFEEDAIPPLLQIISTKFVTVASIFTHLAGADEAIHNEFTLDQLKKFNQLADTIEQTIGYSTIRHALNSAGIVRFPEAQMGMVRLGIGLYGVETNGLFQNELETVGTLKTIISQVKKIKKGESVGYSRKGFAKDDMTTATIAIGYADGYDRGFSNGVGQVLINGVLCPIIGNVCMDMCMVDITGVAAKEGDEVIIFGKNPSILELAKSIQTIPYEILTGVSDRVKRVFYAE